MRSNKLTKLFPLLTACAIVAAIGASARSDDDRVAAIIRAMSLEEKVGQLMFMFPGAARMPYETIAKYKVGGVFVGERQVVPKPPEKRGGEFAQFLPARDRHVPIDSKRYAPERLVPAVRAITDRLRAMSPTYDIGGAKTRIPMFIAGDFEGGELPALSWGVTDVPSLMAVAKTNDAALFVKSGRIIGADMRALGFNMNFGPVAEVAAPNTATFMGSRVAGDDPMVVREVVSRVIAGLAESGIVATAKHFPGHGDSMGNPHHETAWRSEITARDISPFVGIKAPFIMTAHVNVGRPGRGVPGPPISIDPNRLPKLIRENNLGDAIFITDELLFMKAVRIGLGGGRDAISPDLIAKAAVMAFEAGNDMILFRDEKRLPIVANALYDYFGRHPDRLDKNLSRLLKFKLNLSNSLLKFSPVEESILGMKNRSTEGREIARAAVKIEQKGASLRGFKAPILVLAPSNGPHHENLATIISMKSPTSEVSPFYFPLRMKDWDKNRAITELNSKNPKSMYSLIREKAANNGNLAMILACSRAEEAYFVEELVAKLRNEGIKPRIQIVLLGPREIFQPKKALGGDIGLIVAYSRTRVSLEAVADILFGD